MGDNKIRENRLRRMAERQGLRLVKSRRRDRHASGYGTYTLIDAATSDSDAAVGGFGLDLDAIEHQLRSRPET
jgi:hypothetical protein